MDPALQDPDEFFRSTLPARYAAVKDRVQGLSSVGSLTVRVLTRGEWSLRIRDGELEVTRGMDDDVMIQLTVPAEDFGPLVVEADSASQHAARAPQGALLRVLGTNPETARLVRHVPGGVLFVARDGAITRRLLVTPGRRNADLAVADCTIECSLDDVREARDRGESFMTLFVQGKLRITGNVQIAMALSAVFT